MTNTSELTTIPAATITGTDGQTYTLELRPEINPDYGIRYGIYTAETGDDTETSGKWFGSEEVTEEDRAQAEESALHAMSIAWGAPDWNLTSLN